MDSPSLFFRETSQQTCHPLTTDSFCPSDSEAMESKHFRVRSVTSLSSGMERLNQSLPRGSHFVWTRSPPSRDWTITCMDFWMKKRVNLSSSLRLMSTVRGKRDESLVVSYSSSLVVSLFVCLSIRRKLLLCVTASAVAAKAADQQVICFRRQIRRRLRVGDDHVLLIATQSHVLPSPA